LVDTLQAVARRVVAVTASAIAESSNESITLAQYRTLVVLAGSPGATAGEVAAELGVSPPAVTRLLRTLTRRRLLTRRVNPEDRRQVRLQLTPSATRLIASVARSRERQFRRAVKPLSATQRAALLRGLEELLEGLDVTTR
jgi:DNA-binding MarR family transcriptional regulator